MNAHDGLLQIRDRLAARDARPETIQLVNTMIKRAAVPGAEKAQASLSQLVRMLARTPVANGNVGVYDDLVGLQDELESASADRAAQAAAEAARPIPKSKKFYKQRKEQEKRAAG
jgi:hypothetical protein